MIDASHGLGRRRESHKKTKDKLASNNARMILDDDNNVDDDICSSDEGSIVDGDEDGEDNCHLNTERDQIFGPDHSLYEYHKTLKNSKLCRNPIVRERFTGK